MTIQGTITMETLYARNENNTVIPFQQKEKPQQNVSH